MKLKFMGAWCARTGLAAIGFLAGLSAWAQSGAVVVGEVTMAIGQANIASSDGAVATAGRGTVVRAGDRIETQAGGHVHIRFVDGGRLSVRPASRLMIEDYAQAAAGVQNSAIRFRLDEGVVRSITGAWGEAARDRFRLNTPVAAIGIKGTDFVVRSDSNATAASVYSGAIVVSPLQGCQALVGPCNTPSDRLLSEDMRGMMVELNRLQGTPVLVNAVDLMANNRGKSTAAAPVAVAPTPAAAAPSDGVTHAEPSPHVSDKTIVADARGASAVDAITAAVQNGSVRPEPPTITPPVPSGPLPQMVWQRYAVAPISGETGISQPYSEASVGGYETVFANSQYRLLRLPLSTGSALASATGKVDLRLAGSEVQFQNVRTGQTEAGRVDLAFLQLDFNEAQFNTRLFISASSFSGERFSAKGSISPGGVLRATGSAGNVSGAVSQDLQSAGYQFTKIVDTGLISGITLWGR
jgi:FecR protein